MKKTLLLLILCLAFAVTKAVDTTFYFNTSDKVKLYVRVAGKGEPCLFVHGGPGSSSRYLEATTTAKLLEQKLQMIYFDQRGSGRSGSAQDSNYSPARFSKDIEELREFLKIKKWNVMGHSFGGLVITDYATRYPQHIRSLLFIHTTMNMRASMQSHVDFGINELGLKDSILFNNNIPVEQRTWKVHQALSEKGLWYKLMYRNAFEKTFNDSITDFNDKFNRDFASRVWGVPEFNIDMTPLTAKISKPVLVMTGDRDFAIGVDHYKSFKFPNQKVVHYIGGHAPFQEEPQWFSEKVLDFILSVR